MRPAVLRPSVRSWSDAPNNLSTFLGGFTQKIMIIKITRRGNPKNSSDLDLGRRPELKSDEFSGLPRLVIEIMRCKVTAFSKKVIHLSEHHSMAPFIGLFQVNA